MLSSKISEVKGCSFFIICNWIQKTRYFQTTQLFYRTYSLLFNNMFVLI